MVRSNHVAPSDLGEAHRSLRPHEAGERSWLDVSDEVHGALTAPIGSVLVLLPQAGDATWLNLARTVFSERKLKVVLFCDHATSIALAEHAPDFYDWIARHCDCPPGPVPHAVSGLRAAEAAGVPVVWRGSGDVFGIERVKRAFSLRLLAEALLVQGRYEEAKLISARAAQRAEGLPSIR